jgi:hypothetical protein
MFGLLFLFIYFIFGFYLGYYSYYFVVNMTFCCKNYMKSILFIYVHPLLLFICLRFMRSQQQRVYALTTFIFIKNFQKFQFQLLAFFHHSNFFRLWIITVMIKFTNKRLLFLDST